MIRMTLNTVYIQFMINNNIKIYNLSFILGVCLSLENNEEDHDHTYGHINFCNVCWWKEIKTTDGQLIYFSTRKCSCIRKSREQKEISICITMSTIE